MKTIWITRSVPEPLAEALAAHGWQAIVEPVLRIEPVTDWQDVTDIQPPALVIVTSQHAVQPYLASPLANETADVLHIALGATTGKLLERASLAVQMPAGNGSEAVLKMPSVKALKRDALVWLVGGVGGRQALQKGLAQRNIKSVKLAYYRRIEHLPDARSIAKLDGVEVSSLTALNVVARSLPGTRRNVPLVAVSPRIQQAATKLGFTQVVAADSAAPKDIVRSLGHL